jgi:hypothetical protein
MAATHPDLLLRDDPIANFLSEIDAAALPPKLP